MRKNRLLNNLLRKIEDIANNAKNEEDFRPIYELLRIFINKYGKIEYNHKINAILSCIFIPLASFYTTFYFQSHKNETYLSYSDLFVIAVFWLISLYPFIKILIHEDRILKISDLIFDKDVLFDNQLSKEDIFGLEKILYEKMEVIFGDFRKRGKNQKILEHIKGHFIRKYLYFNYSYYSSE